MRIGFTNIQLGKVNLSEDIPMEQYNRLNSVLKAYGLELMEDKKKILVESIKTSLMELLHSDEYDLTVKYSEYLSNKLNYDYTYLSNTFSEMEGSTIEKYFIVNRIERVKELIVYEKLTVTEIAYHLNFSSVSHLCLQFKKITGITPSDFKKNTERVEFVWKDV